MKLYFSFFFFRKQILSDVYSLLADLVDWSDELLLSKSNNIKPEVDDNDKYKKIAHDLIRAIKVRTN